MKSRLQEERRAYVRLIEERTGLTPTEIARESDLVPSTLTRFMNKEVNHTLSDMSLAKIRDRFGDDPEPTRPISPNDRLKRSTPSAKARLHSIVRGMDEVQAVRAIAVLEAVFRDPTNDAAA